MPARSKIALQVAVEGFARGVDAVVDAGLAQLLERGQRGQHAEQMPGVGPAVGDRPSRGQTEHQVFPPGDGGERQPVGQRLGVRRQVRA